MTAPKNGYGNPRRPADDPNEAIILMDYKDLKKAKDFSTSADLKETMKHAGVVASRRSI